MVVAFAFLSTILLIVAFLSRFSRLGGLPLEFLLLSSQVVVGSFG